MAGDTAAHEFLAPSPWVLRWTAALPPASEVLDVACGSGRHVRALIAAGHRVTAIDRDAEALAGLRARPELRGAALIEADLEDGPWPLPERRFDAIVVTNYLWRPLWPTLVAHLAPGGWFIHETFAAGQETVGRPRRPEFLLRPGELLDAVRDHLRVVGYEDGFLTAPPCFVQRIAAVHEPDTAADAPARHRL